MLLHEEDAKKRWCPFGSNVAFNPTMSGINSDDAIYDTRGESKGFIACIGSNCMCWRWSKGNLGYCGLAGKPEGID